MSHNLVDDRRSDWQATQREARKRIEVSPQASTAVHKLIGAGIRESDLWLVLSSALHMNRTLADTVEHDRLQLERDQLAKISLALAELAEFIDETLTGYPSLFSPEIRDVPADRIISAFGDIANLMYTRAFLARHHRALLEATRYAGGADDPESRQATARRFAIGEIAYWVFQLDPKHASHSREIVRICKALLGGKLTAREVLACRDARSKLERVLDEKSVPRTGSMLVDLTSREAKAEDPG